MKPSKHIDEPAGRMVNNHGHWEYRYDDPALNPPLPPEPAAAPARKMRAVASTSSTCPNPTPPREAVDQTAAVFKPRRHGSTAERQRTFLPPSDARETRRWHFPVASEARGCDAGDARSSRGGRVGGA